MHPSLLLLLLCEQYIELAHLQELYAVNASIRRLPGEQYLTKTELIPRLRAKLEDRPDQINAHTLLPREFSEAYRLKF